MHTYFNPRTPCGVRRNGRDKHAHATNFNPRTPCGVRPLILILILPWQSISIHAPHAGCDIREFGAYSWDSKFQSTHPMRGATHFCNLGDCIRRFQSTHPMRGATLLVSLLPRPRLGFQSTHPMRGATARDARRARVSVISIHAPHAGCDSRTSYLCWSSCISIHAPHAGCDADMRHAGRVKAISIHAPHAGCDPSRCRCAPMLRNFNPRTPCGVRRRSALLCCMPVSHFNPRTPCGVRQYKHQRGPPKQEISIHAPHAGCDGTRHLPHAVGKYFNPRTPCGVRRGWSW